MKDYKKKYEEANKIVATRFGSDVAREIFKDLYEIQDESIRKGLIDYFKYCKSSGRKTANNIDISDIIAWLEKLGDRQETICEKCKREHSYHSCQDITELGKCVLEYQIKK